MSLLESGHKVEYVKGEELAELERNFAHAKFGFIRLVPEGWFLTATFEKYANKIYNFKFRPTDVLMVTYPKTGSSWLQEIVWTMRNNRTLTNEDAINVKLIQRSPFIEFDMLNDELENTEDSKKYFNRICPGRELKDDLYFQLAECTPDPRTLKTHLPLSLFNPQMIDTCKVIYLARHPKDVCVSYYHFNQLLKLLSYKGDMDFFMDCFMKDKMLYTPYWLHMKEAWEKRNHPNVFFFFYEDMKKNPREKLQEINQFIGAQLTEEEIDKVLEWTSFDAMKKRDELKKKEAEITRNAEVAKEGGSFYRKGKVGDWKNSFTKEQEEKMDRWIKDNVKEFGPDFPYAKDFN